MRSKLTLIVVMISFAILAITSCGDDDGTTSTSNFTVNGVAIANGSNLDADSTELKIKIYKFALSTSIFCTNPVTIFEYQKPDYTYLSSSPIFGSGQVADGTYNCVVIEVSDQIKSISQHCNNSAEQIIDICQSESTILLDGTTTSCSSKENRIAIYLSTTSTATKSIDPYHPPTTTNDDRKGYQLAHALTVNGKSGGELGVSGTIENCDLTLQVFSFSQP